MRKYGNLVWFLSKGFGFSMFPCRREEMHCKPICFDNYSHLSNNRGGWNKRVGGAKVAKSINVEVGIKVEGGIFLKKLVHKCNKRGVEEGKI